MKSTLAVTLAAAAGAAALPTTRDAAPSGINFHAVAIHSGSNIQYASVNANSLRFWLDKDTATYCPASALPAGTCDDRTTSTVFSFAYSGTTLSLDVEVAGGELVYVASDGRLKFTQAHSVNMGEGSTAQGFEIVDSRLQFEGDGWLACEEEGAYGVYAAAKVGDDKTDCLGFAFHPEQADNSTKVAWEYV